MSLLLTFLATALTVGGLTLTAAPANADTLDTPVFSDTAAVTLTVMAGQTFENRDFVPVAPTDLSNVTVDIFYGSWFTTLDIAKDGTISGYVPYAGTIDATLWARNDTTGSYSTRDIHIIAKQPAQIIAQPSFGTTVGQTTSTNIYLTGTPPPTLTAEGLPSGLSLTLTTAGTKSTWALSGTPARGTV